MSQVTASFEPSLDMVKPRCEFHFCYLISFFFIWCILFLWKDASVVTIIWTLQFIFHCKWNWRPCLSSSGSEQHPEYLKYPLFFVPGLCSRIGCALWISILFYLFWICSHINCILYFPHLISLDLYEVFTLFSFAT